MMLISLVTRGLDEVPAAGGPTRKAITTVASQNFYNPQFLPIKDGRRIVLAGVGTMTRQNLELIDLETGKREVLRDGGYPSWSPIGHILFRASTAQAGVWALPFSLETLKPVGEALPILDSGRDFSDSWDGTLLWTNFHPRGQTRLVWRDRSGKLLATAGQPQEAMRALSISPDGKRVALSAYEHGNLDVWIHDLERPVKTRLTFDPGNDLSAQWSPLGKEIAFYSVRSGESLDIWLQAADGSSEAQPLAKTPLIEIPTSWSRDGSMLFFSRIDPKTGSTFGSSSASRTGRGKSQLLSCSRSSMK
jgi:hypothetical protein